MLPIFFARIRMEGSSSTTSIRPGSVMKVRAQVTAINCMPFNRLDHAFTEDLGITFEGVKLKSLGHAKRVAIDKDNTTIVDGAGACSASFNTSILLLELGLSCRAHLDNQRHPPAWASHSYSFSLSCKLRHLVTLPAEPTLKELHVVR
jgi:hypothetical protein